MGEAATRGCGPCFGGLRFGIARSELPDCKPGRRQKLRATGGISLSTMLEFFLINGGVKPIGLPMIRMNEGATSTIGTKPRCRRPARSFGVRAFHITRTSHACS
jgi:hypothetical protein